MANNRHRCLYRYYKRHRHEFSFEESFHIATLNLVDSIERTCKRLNICIARMAKYANEELNARISEKIDNAFLYGEKENK